MSSSAVMASSDLPAAMAATRALESSSFIELLPSEIIAEIMMAVRPTELAKLVLASKRLLAVFLEAQPIILTKVLSKQPEFKTMLLVATTTDRDFWPGRMLYPRTITLDTKASGFAFSPDQSNDIVLLKSNMEEDPNFQAIRMRPGNLVKVWRLLKTVDWYVDMYPTVRWRDQPEQRRCLRADEEARLRKAIARWYLYTIHFQANRHRDLYKPKKWAQDNRLHHMRLMPTREILELQDFWGVMYDMVSHDLCSSVEQLDPEDGGGVDRVPWGKDQGRHSNIVSTYMKLDPDMLKDFLYRYWCRPKMDIVYAARTNKRDFNLDTESMSSAIMTVLEERMMLKSKDVSTAPRSGILNEDRDEDVDPKVWEQDDAPNGQPPLDPAQIRAFPWENQKRLAYGDDGSGEPY